MDHGGTFDDLPILVASPDGFGADVIRRFRIDPVYRCVRRFY